MHNCSTSFLITQQHNAWATEKWCDSSSLATLACWEGTQLAKPCSRIYLAPTAVWHLCAVHQKQESSDLSNAFFIFWYNLPARNQMTTRQCFIESWSPWSISQESFKIQVLKAVLQKLVVNTTWCLTLYLKMNLFFISTRYCFLSVGKANIKAA